MTDPQGPRVPLDIKGVELIDFHSNGNRITGLIAEDRIRTTNLFQPGAVTFHPTAAVDIDRRFDMRQGLDTHVKTTLDDTLGMASTVRIYELKGPVRFVICLYDKEKATKPGGRIVDVCRFHTIIEAIATDATLKTMWGNLTIDDVMPISIEMSAYEYHTSTIIATRARFKALTASIRGRMGIARHTGKLDKNQNRLQSYMAVSALRAQIATEPKVFQGRMIGPQLSWREFTDDFYGLKLPWRTTEEQRIFPKPKDPDAPQRKRSPKIAKPVVDPDAKYVGAHIGRVDHRVAGGEISIVPHGDERTIAAKGNVRDFRRHVSIMCKAAGGRWVEAGRLWVLTAAQAQDAHDRLLVPPMPEPDPDVMEQVGGNPNLFRIVCHDGVLVRALRQPHSNWALRPDDGRGQSDPKAARQASSDRIDLACRAFRQGTWNDTHGNWLIPQQPEHLIHRMAVAIRDVRP